MIWEDLQDIFINEKGIYMYLVIYDLKYFCKGTQISGKIGCLREREIRG